MRKAPPPGVRLTIEPAEAERPVGVTVYEPAGSAPEDYPCGIPLVPDVVTSVTWVLERAGPGAVVWANLPDATTFAADLEMARAADGWMPSAEAETVGPGVTMRELTRGDQVRMLTIMASAAGQTVTMAQRRAR